MNKRKRGAWLYYQIKDGKIVKRKPICPRCGSFMAEHSGRLHCGRCGYTEFKSRE